MSTEFKVPELGEGVDSAEVSRVYVSEGDTIDADQNVMELETEKAVADLPCPHAGTIAKVHITEGDTIKVGQTILTLEDQEPGREAAEEQPEEAAAEETEEPPAEEEAEAEKEKEAEEKAAEEEAAEKPQREEPAAEEQEEAAREEGDAGPEPEREAEEKEGKPEQRKARQKREEREEPPPPAGPATRRLARKLGIDLHDVRGSGPSGRITQEDVVEAHDRSRPAAAPGGGAQPPLPDFERFGPVERQRLNKIARTAMKNLRTSWAAVPHVTQHDLADVTDLEAARRRYLQGPGQSGPKITLTAIAVKAVTTVLEQFPHVNASLDAEREELILKQHYHIGVAVDTEEGLLVPVVRDADRKNIVELAVELADVAERARNRKLSMEEMEGATFTISNQGGIGGTAFTPIVSFPQVAILGLSRARPEVQMADGRPQERLMLPLSLSYDHRAINGADAARFLVRLSAELSDCFQLLIRT